MFAAASAVSQFHELVLSMAPSSTPSSQASNPPTLVVLESTSNLMTKVQLSGGGRCNVLHDTNKPLATILQGYPRGRKELQGIMTSEFGPVQAKAWFEQRGVQLKTEGDGRMFPTTDSSQTIVDTIYKAVVVNSTSYGRNHHHTTPTVRIEQNQRVVSVHRVDDTLEKNHNATTSTSTDTHTSYFQVLTTTSDHNIHVTWNFHTIIFATGSSRTGYDMAASLGHNIISPVPSLFTLSTKKLIQPGGVFYDLAGISVPKVQLTWIFTDTDVVSSTSTITITNHKKRTKKIQIQQEGPLLITHVGISGPASLKLSAFGAREFHQAQYTCNITIHWIPDLGSTKKQVEDILWSFVSMYPKRKVSSYFPFQEDDKDNNNHNSILNNTPSSSSSSSNNSPMIPKRLWTALVSASGVLSYNKKDEDENDLTWGDMSKAKIRQLSKTLCEFTLPISGKGVFKDEFVTAGGICLKSVNMKSMESKIQPGLYFCGEMLNVDGVTGGYNFMNCWSTGYVAGKNAMNRCFVRWMKNV